MATWGNQSTLKEGKDIQSRLESSLSRDSDDTIARKFATMMLNGNGKSAMRYVVNQVKGGVLKLDEATKQQLYDKHPMLFTLCAWVCNTQTSKSSWQAEQFAFKIINSTA